MASTNHIATAKLYKFPVRARAQSAARGGYAPVAELHGPRLQRMDFGSAWYHDAAMADEQRASIKRDEH